MRSETGHLRLCDEAQASSDLRSRSAPRLVESLGREIRSSKADAMRVVTWNMNYWPRSDDARTKSWDFLRLELRADIALVQEAVPPPDVDAVFHPIDPDNPRQRWGTAVVAFSPKYQLRARKRRQLGTPSGDDALPESHRGSCAVADVVDRASGELRLVAVSFYGAWEYLPGDPKHPERRKPIYSTATSHRTISDLTPLLAASGRKETEHRTPVLVAGDFNATTQVASENWWRCEIEEARVLFDRLEALGLHDLMDHTKTTRAALAGCSCKRAACSHVRTYRYANRQDSRPTQLDYAFASEALLAGVAVDVWDRPAAWALSDHCPIVVDLPGA